MQLLNVEGKRAMDAELQPKPVMMQHTQATGVHLGTTAVGRWGFGPAAVSILIGTGCGPLHRCWCFVPCTAVAPIVLVNPRDRMLSHRMLSHCTGNPNL